MTAKNVRERFRGDGRSKNFETEKNVSIPKNDFRPGFPRSSGNPGSSGARGFFFRFLFPSFAAFRERPRGNRFGFVGFRELCGFFSIASIFYPRFSVAPFFFLRSV
jgi:hypothetical protein